MYENLRNPHDGVFRRIAAYAIQAEEHLPLEASNLLIAGSIDLVVHVSMRTSQRLVVGADGTPVEEQAGISRYVSSVREVTGAEGSMVVSNEIYRPGPDGRAVPGAPIRQETVAMLADTGWVRPERGEW